MGERIPGTFGTDPSELDESADGFPPTAGFEIPGPIGIEPMKAGDRIITTVTTDWDPLVLETTPEIEVGGKNLEQAADELNGLNEWGRGGGGVANDAVPFGTSSTVTVSLHGKFERVLPTWKRYASASAKARAEWDRMVAALTVHEDRHVEMAVEEANKLAKDLIGKEIAQLVMMVNATGRTIRQRQEKLDTDTDHGSKPGVKYGGVSLDISIP